MLDNFFIIFIFRRYPINECQQSLIFYKFFFQPFVVFHFYEKLCFSSEVNSSAKYLFRQFSIYTVLFYQRTIISINTPKNTDKIIKKLCSQCYIEFCSQLFQCYSHLTFHCIYRNAQTFGYFPILQSFHAA